MATTVIFIRHGESEANAASRFAGHSDFPLSERGHRQAVCTAEYLKDTPIDIFYASDLARAFATAQHVADTRGMQVIPDRGLREIYAGAWEGMRYTDIMETYTEDYTRWKTDIGNAFCTDGERVADLQIRVRAAVERIVKENRGKTICIGTHATPIRVMQCIFMGLPLSEMHTVPWVPNASVTRAVYEDSMEVSSFSAGEWEHLGALSTVPSKKV